MNAHSNRLLFAFAFGTALAAQAPAPLVQSAADLLPASTYAAVRFGGLAACADATAHLPLTPVVQQLLQKLPAELRAEHLEAGLEQAVAKVQDDFAAAGLSPADVRAVLRRPMTLALGRLSVEGMGPSVALVIEAGDAGPAIDRVLQVLEGMAAQAGDLAAASAVEVGGQPARLLQLQDGQPVFTATVAGHFVLTNSRGFLRECVATASGQQPSLAKQSPLGALQRRLPQPALAALFVHAARLSSMFDDHLPYEAAEFAAALGLGQIDAIYAATTADADGGADLLHLGVRGSEQGLCKALLAQPAELGFAARCSANTVVFAAGSMDVPAVLGAFEKFVALLPAEARSEVERDLGREVRRNLRGMGSSPEQVRELLAAFGTQVGMALALEKGAVPKPELLLQVAVREAGPVQQLLQRVEAMVAERGGLEWKARKVGEHEIRYVSLPLPEANLQLSPCYALLPDALLVGSDVQALVRALKQDADGALAAQADFQALRQQAAGQSGVLHLRLSRAAELGWRTVETMAYPQVDAHRDELGFGSEALPDAETMAKALGTCSLMLRVDDDGVAVQSRGTFAVGAALAAVGAVVDEVLTRACGKVY